MQQVSCGQKHVLALTAEGVVYSWGSNADGALGQGKDKPFLDLPLELPHVGPEAGLPSTC